MDKIEKQVICGQTLSFNNNPALVGPEASYYFNEQGAIVISENGFIEWQGSENQLPIEYKNCTKINYRDYLILPGFVDAHLHYPQFRMLAAYGENLLDWLNRYTFIEEQYYENEQHAKNAASLFINELHQHGITSALVFSTIHPIALDSLMSESAKHNMAIISGKTMMNRNAPVNLCDSETSGYEESKELVLKWDGKGRNRYAITVRFAITSSESQLEAAGTLCNEYPRLLFQTHLSENLQEIETVRRDFPWSQDYTDVYDKYGLLSPRSIFAHGIHLSNRELSCLKESQSAIVHCPTSNNFLGSGLFKYHQTRKKLQQNKIGVGSDIGGGTSFSMLQTLADAYKVSQLVGSRMSAFEGFYLATLGNAKILNLENEIGTLEAGKFADLVVLDPQATPLLKARHSLSENLHDVLFALMILGDDRAVKHTYIAGKKKK